METGRDYISSSQCKTWQTSPKEFYKRYADDKTYGTTKYQQFGKDLMEALEFDKEFNIPPRLIKMLIGYQFEEKIYIDGFGGKKLLGFIDAVSSSKEKFIEIKTGKNAWNKADVIKDEQILFYAMIMRKKYGKIPTAKLVWVETRDTEDGGIEFTGNVKSFVRTFTPEELANFEVKVAMIIQEIQHYTYSELDLSVYNDRLTKLMHQKNTIDAELDVVKAEILADLISSGERYGDTENFNITLASRKTWTYSDELKAEIKYSADEFKARKKEEEKDGVATSKGKDYLMVRVRN